MNITDPEITFDENGVCNHCHTYDWLEKEYIFTGEDGVLRLKKIVEKIRRAGIGKELGLRPLAVHLDNGWDSEPGWQNYEI